MIDEMTGGELVSPEEVQIFDEAKKRESYEARQVSPSESTGLGFYFVDLAKGEKRGWDLQPESTVAVWSLPAYEKVDLRLGRSDYNRQLSYFRAYKNVCLRVECKFKSIWEWLAR